jgi:hypothetical protein
MEHIGHLEWERRYDAAIAKGRGTAEVGPDRETAISELKALNLTAGEAEAAIDRKKR